MDTTDRTAARQRRRQRAGNTLAVTAGLLGVLCLFAGPAVGGQFQTPLLVLGAALIGSELLWLVQRTADERARLHADRIIVAIEALQETSRDGTIDLAAAVCTVVDDLDKHMVRDAGLLRRQLEDLLGVRPAPRPAPPAARWVQERPEVESPTAEIDAVTDGPQAADQVPAESPAEPGPLDDGWFFASPAEREAAAS